MADLSVSAGPQKFFETFTVENPSNSEKVVFLRFDVAVTIQKIVLLVKGASPSLAVSMRHGADTSAAGTEVVTGGTVVTNTTTGQTVTSFSNPSIAAGSYLWLTTTALSGTVSAVDVNVYAEEA